MHKKWLWEINEGENDGKKINTTVYRKDTQVEQIHISTVELVYTNQLENRGIEVVN